jgi:hypothetical protein
MHPRLTSSVARIPPGRANTGLNASSSRARNAASVPPLIRTYAGANHPGDWLIPMLVMKTKRSGRSAVPSAAKARAPSRVKSRVMLVSANMHISRVSPLVHLAARCCT